MREYEIIIWYIILQKKRRKAVKNEPWLQTVYSEREMNSVCSPDLKTCAATNNACFPIKNYVITMFRFVMNTTKHFCVSFKFTHLISYLTQYHRACLQQCLFQIQDGGKSGLSPSFSNTHLIIDFVPRNKIAPPSAIPCTPNSSFAWISQIFRFLGLIPHFLGFLWSIHGLWKLFLAPRRNPL